MACVIDTARCDDGCRTPAGTGDEPMTPMPGIRRLRLATAVVALGLLSGCVNGSETDDSARDAAIYRSVVLDVVDRSGIELDRAEQPPVLFIESLDADEIPLRVQVEVVGGLIEQYEIRFIDDRDEAVEIDLPGVPVRADSLLIGLGGIDVDETAQVRSELHVQVHSELYVHIDDIRGFSYTLMEAGGAAWKVVGAPAEIEPEGLVPAP